MNQKEILEGNKLIAEFATEITQELIRDDEYNFPDHLEFKPVLKFDCSWDWLMPVVEKIESLQYFIEIRNDNVMNTIYTTCTISDSVFVITEPMMVSKIEAIWLAVIEFIKWYNTQKLNP